MSSSNKWISDCEPTPSRATAILRRFRGNQALFYISDLVKVGENEIQVKVASTLANHMSSYPTKFVYEGQTASGLLGPVQLQFLAKVNLTAAAPKTR